MTNTNTTPDPLDLACAIEFFEEHGQPLNAAAVRNLAAERDALAATVAAIPDAHHAANLAHARVARDRFAAIVYAARGAAQRLLDQEQRHAGSGRDGHLNEADLVPLLEALGVIYLGEPENGVTP